MPVPAESSRRRRYVIGGLLAAFALLAVLGWVVLTGSGETETAAAPTPVDAPSSASPEDDAARDEAIALLRAEPRREEGDPFAQGELDAPLVLVEFADYRCPYCAKHAQEVAPILQKYVDDGTVRLEWRHLPIFGDESIHVHHAAHAAGLQGKFWEYHEAVFAQTPLEGHRDWSEADLRAVAEEVGVPNLELWEADRVSPELAQAVEEDRRHATEDLGITATPAFILGDVFIPGAYPLSTFVQQIEAQSSR